MNFITFLLISTTLFCIFFTVIRAEEECLYGKINCYDCNSKEFPGCGDPFNTSAVPAPRMCHGCCVKMVQYRDSPEQYIRRTCTKELDINLFMVDHICMDASDGMGHMCFCESSNCNSANSQQLFKGLDKYVILFLIICSSIFMTNMNDNFRKL